MRALYTTLLFPALLVSVAAASIFGLGDRRTLTRPPEATVEGFVRALITKRHERALPYLAQAEREAVSAKYLENYAADLEQRHGKIEDVRGERISLSGERAQARALLRTEKGWEGEAYRLVFEEGVWVIELADARISTEIGFGKEDLVGTLIELRQDLPR